ncbi:MAG: hypothetical protein IPJ34_16080 [Myxococcales bacterium]|nr:hypothetical protein [Myxococcales bacterium]
MSNPEVRAAMVKDLLASLRAGKVPRGAEILGLAEPDLVRRVDEATRLEWLPSPPIARLADKARALLGGPRWRAVHREAADELAERALFRAVTRGMRVVFGATLATQCRIIPLVLNQAHRNYGTIDLTTSGPRAATVRIRGCPPEGLSQGLLDVFAGTVEGLLAAASIRSVVDVDYVVGSSEAALAVREEA